MADLKDHEIVHEAPTREQIGEARRLGFAFCLAERELGLQPQPRGKDGEIMQLLPRVDLILAAADGGGGLTADLYRLCWMIRNPNPEAAREAAP